MCGLFIPFPTVEYTGQVNRNCLVITHEFNVFHHRADQTPEWITKTRFHPQAKIEAFKPPSMPPKVYKNSKKIIKQEGRILLAISAIKKKRKFTVYIKYHVFIIFLLPPSISNYMDTVFKLKYAPTHIY